MSGEGRGLSRQGDRQKTPAVQWQLRRAINASNGSGDVFFARFGEDDGDVDGAQ